MNSRNSRRRLAISLKNSVRSNQAGMLELHLAGGRLTASQALLAPMREGDQVALLVREIDVDITGPAIVQPAHQRERDIGQETELEGPWRRRPERSRNLSCPNSRR